MIFIKSCRSLCPLWLGGAFLHWVFLLTPCLPVHAGSAFVHPGLLHSRDDLERMKDGVAAQREPVFSGFEVFRNDPQSRSNYTMRGPRAEIGRNPNVNSNEYDSDANAAYQCAIMWCITGDAAYAAKSKEILNAWSSTLKSVTGRDAVLMAGLGPFKMVNAAEIIRHTGAGWPEVEVRRTERHFRDVIYPVLKDFAPFANGNWDTAALKTVMAIGVFCDDRAMFERALRYCVNGAGDGRLTHYVISGTGQCQESGRDMPHTLLGLAHLGDCCEIAWHQGLNLYGYADNRLLKGFEYTAKYNLGQNVPFVETLDRTGKYHHTAISTNGRGRLRAVFEQIYNHYVNRAGIPAPWTQQAAEKIRPEGPGLPGADHPGFGTLLFSRPRATATAAPPRAAPAAPGGVVAQGSTTGNHLTWIESIGATRYAVKRSAVPNGPGPGIAENVTGPSYDDAKVEAGKVYYYTVSAANAVGESPDALAVAIGAGLPKPWSQRDVGRVAVAGGTSFDGETFTLEGAGADIGGTNDQFQFASVPMDGDGAVSARYVPQLSSQFTRFGLMMREGAAADAPQVSLIVRPERGASVEAPAWSARLVVRESTGAQIRLRGTGVALPAPAVVYGRLVGNLWLRLERRGDVFTGSISIDDQAWMPAGTVRFSANEKLLAGLAVCSRLTNVTTIVRFDDVTAPGWP